MWSLNICGDVKAAGGGREWDGLGWGSVDCRRSSKSTRGERPRRATQISVGKIGSAQIPSALFLFRRASNLAWVSGHFAARPKLVL
jgi:hypothetical protein